MHKRTLRTVRISVSVFRNGSSGDKSPERTESAWLRAPCHLYQPARWKGVGLGTWNRTSSGEVCSAWERNSLDAGNDRPLSAVCGGVRSHFGPRLGDRLWRPDVVAPGAWDAPTRSPSSPSKRPVGSSRLRNTPVHRHPKSQGFGLS